MIYPTNPAGLMWTIRGLYLSFTKSTFSQRAVKYSLCLSVGLLSACKGPEDVKAVSPVAEVVTDAKTASKAKQIEPLIAPKPGAPSTYGLSQEQFEVFDDLITTVLSEAPLIARVQDVRISYPEWTDSDPNDYFEEALIEHHVKRVDVLHGGEFPPSFSYLVYGEAVEVPLRKRPYIVALCRDKKNRFIAKAMMCVLPSHIDGFDALLDARLQNAAPPLETEARCQGA